MNKKYLEKNIKRAFPKCPQDIIDRTDFYWTWFERPKRIIREIFFSIIGIGGLYNVQKRIQREVNRHRWEIVYEHPFDIVMLIGWTDQYEEDCYYVVWDFKEGVRLMSCVGGFYFLKDRLTRYEYSHAEYVWYLNNPSREEILRICKKKKIKLK
jgi:hypothetical protein